MRTDSDYEDEDTFDVNAAPVALKSVADLSKHAVNKDGS